MMLSSGQGSFVARINPHHDDGAALRPREHRSFPKTATRGASGGLPPPRKMIASCRSGPPPAPGASALPDDLGNQLPVAFAHFFVLLGRTVTNSRPG